MSHLPFTLLAYLFNATAVLIDKFLLVKHIPNPLVFIFYFSLFSLLAFLLVPFVKLPTTPVLLLASVSTLLWTSGAYFMFKALQIGQASRVIPVIGTLIPVILTVEAFYAKEVSTIQITAIVLLILGLVFLTLFDWRGTMKVKEAVFELISAGLFAVSYLVLRQAYLQADFLTVLVWSRFIIIPASLVILLIPRLRQAVFSSDRPSFSLFSKAGLLFLVAQGAGGLSEILITFSVSLANPALVNSLQGTQYAFLFLFSIILARRFPKIFQEKLSVQTVLSKITGIGFIGAGLYLLAR